MYRFITMRLRTGKKCLVSGRQEGTVLLLVMLILALISVLILSYAQQWRTELRLTSNFAQVQRARRLSEAGIFYALGKLIAAKTSEMVTSQTGEGFSPDLWQADQRPHLLELPDGKVEIRIADEGGKINLNSAPEEMLLRLFRSLELPEHQVRTMVDSLQDWRSPGNQSRPYGARSSYYLGLNPPYVAKSGSFETVEELAWVRGFEASPLLPKLSRWLTVRSTGMGLNLNTAPLEVLRAVGIPDNIARTIIVTRQGTPLRDFQEFSRLLPTPLLGQQQTFGFRTSPYFTITATGLAINSRARQTTRAIVRVDPSREEPWTIYSWFEGFPG